MHRLRAFFSKTGRQRKPPSIELAITKTKLKVYDDDPSGAEAGYWPPAVADPNVSAMTGAEKCLLSLPASLVDHRLPPDFLATGPPFLPRD